MGTGKESTSEESQISLEAMSRRLELLRGVRPYAYIAQITGLSTESARRHVQHGNPHPDFLARVCLATKCSTDWLLLGRGPILREDAVIHTIQDASLAHLGHALGLALQRIDLALSKAGILSTPPGSIELKPGYSGSGRSVDRPKGAPSVNPSQPPKRDQGTR
jgi:hypothetical protein